MWVVNPRPRIALCTTLSPVAGEGEGGPEVRGQRSAVVLRLGPPAAPLPLPDHPQLGLAQRLRLAQRPLVPQPPVELAHQGVGRLVRHLPLAGQHGAGPGHLERPLQPQHPLAAGRPPPPPAPPRPPAARRPTGCPAGPAAGPARPPPGRSRGSPRRPRPAGGWPRRTPPRTGPPGAGRTPPGPGGRPRALGRGPGRTPRPRRRRTRAWPG